MTLREYLKVKNYTIRHFSRLVDIDSAQVCRYLTGSFKPSLDNAYKIYLTTNKKVKLQDWFTVEVKEKSVEDVEF